MTISRIQAPFGALEWDERLGWWQSRDMPLPMFGGQSVPVSIPSDDPDNPQAPIPDDVIAAVNAVLALTPEALAQIEPHVWAYYREMAEEWDDCPDIPRAELWENVQLNGMSVDRRDEDGLIYINIECNCEWEPEHGMQLVLQNGVRWVRVSDYSGHLTEGDAYDCPELDAWMADPNATLPVRSTEEIFAQLESRKR